MSTGKLYLFPSFLAPVKPEDVFPAANIALLSEVKYFVVEELRTARRFLKACDRNIDIDTLHFDVLNEHTDPGAVATMLEPALAGHDMGLISEAGCPAVADPGADLVAVAARKGVEIVPLVGPSSILLSLMASGFNGQSFAFLGYLPFDGAKRTAAFKDMERAIRRGQTQIFIETPYRIPATDASVRGLRPHRPHTVDTHHAAVAVAQGHDRLQQTTRYFPFIP